VQSAKPALDGQLDDEISGRVLFKAPRKRLADLALKLRDIRYVRGGHEPSTGFDCSGFVHYVFRQTFGLMLPYDAPSQFHDGKYVARNQMQTGDLVFFHEGKRISHVGIYLDEGHFIHSPRPGKRVRVDNLDSTYWAKRFAGARRPDVLS
jgi:cell wall-associated NlpC family hydrolase